MVAHLPQALPGASKFNRGRTSDNPAMNFLEKNVQAIVAPESRVKFRQFTNGSVSDRAGVWSGSPFGQIPSPLPCRQGFGEISRFAINLAEAQQKRTFPSRFRGLVQEGAQSRDVVIAGAV